MAGSIVVKGAETKHVGGTLRKRWLKLGTLDITPTKHPADGDVKKKKEERRYF